MQVKKTDIEKKMGKLVKLKDSLTTLNAAVITEINPVLVNLKTAIIEICNTLLDKLYADEKSLAKSLSSNNSYNLQINMYVQFNPTQPKSTAEMYQDLYDNLRAFSSEIHLIDPDMGSKIDDALSELFPNAGLKKYESYIDHIQSVGP